MTKIREILQYSRILSKIYLDIFQNELYLFMDSKLTIEAQRFKKIREELRHTQQSFAELLDIGATTADIERGKTKITGKIVMELMLQFNINPLWIYGKSFEKHIDTSKGDVSPKIITLDASGNDSILLVNQKAAAGYPNNIHDMGWYQTLPAFNIPLPEFRNASYRGFQVEGDSMLPSIKPNEWVLGRAVPSINEATDSKIYIVVLRDSVLVKKLQKVPNNPQAIRLISLNDEYLPIDVKVRDVQELWQVNSKLSFGVDEPSESNLLRQLQQSMDELKGQISSLK
ncbi:putative transcriptional regulator [Aequorivita sublithincola DSM 14238]|uniref:Putative transcriptional regulator n=2 Tax=Aequorivita TaxID=153265 RepID=I3YVZ7_AEQSU|nr:putative transcriptional regulator [Aequorivita sublithincola DSM 14238]